MPLASNLARRLLEVYVERVRTASAESKRFVIGGALVLPRLWYSCE